MIELLAFVIISLVCFGPGVLLSFALFEPLGFGKFEKFFFGLVLGVLAGPTMLITELFFGMSLSTPLIIANAVLLCLAAAALWVKQGKKLEFPGISRESFSKEHFKHLVSKNKVLVVLLAIILFGWYARMASSFDPYFFEFDPIYYNHVTEILVKQGSVPVFNDDAYFPQQKFQRTPPVIHYLTGAWYRLFMDVTGKPFDKELFVLFNQLYPPLLGALLSFLAFVLMREDTDERLALVTAALFAFTPQLIQKMAAGVSEQQPFAIFGSLALFAFYGLAIKKKSLRLGCLAGLAAALNVLGTLQYIWPFMIIASFAVIQAFLDYLENDLDKKTVAINCLVAAGGLAGNLALNAYQQTDLFVLSNATIFLIASLGPMLFLFAAEKYKASEKVGKIFALEPRWAKGVFLAGVLAAMALVAVFVPLGRAPDGGAVTIGSKIGGYITYGLGFSTTDIPLMKTVQEENPSSEGYNESSYGIFSYLFSPANILKLVTLLLSAGMILELLRRQFKLEAAVASAIVVGMLGINWLFDAALSGFAGLLGWVDSPLLAYIVKNDVFLYMGIAIASAMVTYLVSEKKNKLVLFAVLVFYPIAFIGLSKLKYMLHLAFALAIMFGFLLEEIKMLIEALNRQFKFANAESAGKAASFFALGCGVLLVGAQFLYAVGSPMMVSCNEDVSRMTSSLAVPGVQKPSAISELCFARITSDWRDAFKWMRGNLKADNRVLSWWDYGHWIVFWGEAKTVLDPGNAYPEYDQETAHALVNGSTKELVKRMRYHKATHLLLDSELVPKWGALTYLSSTFGAVAHTGEHGTFTGLFHEPDPANNYNITPGNAEWERGPGASTYEQEHYFEDLYNLYVPGEAAGTVARFRCPGNFPREGVYSSLTGAVYCIAAGKDGEPNLFFLNPSTGEQKKLQNLQIYPMTSVPGRDAKIQPVPLTQDGSVLRNAYPVFLNLNPDLYTVSGGTLRSYLNESAFVRLFFYESLPGFETVYRSPGGQVKIFKLLDNAEQLLGQAEQKASVFEQIQKAVQKQAQQEELQENKENQSNQTQPAAGNSNTS